MTKTNEPLVPIISMQLDLPRNGAAIVGLRNSAKHYVGTLVISEKGIAYRGPKSKTTKARVLTWEAIKSLMRSGLIQ